ncbi:MAG TPA: HAMP domain-containing sensor histidine kinase [Cyclobacteriaceae bacterium]|nr:HAMP domain-containing sensor histidine kinase [Cyclobacteriaceae bacterium]
MMHFYNTTWERISQWGTRPSQSVEQRRTVVLTNRISLLITAFSFVLCMLSFTAFGWIYTTQFAFGFTLLFLFPLLLNRLGFNSIARILLSLIISVASIVVSVIDKFDFYQLEEFQYFEFRLTLLTATLVPFYIFNLAEVRYWSIALIFNFLCIVFYDPIHSWFGVGYYQQGFTGPNYYFLNFITLAAFFIIALITFLLKRSYEKSEAANKTLIEELKLKSNELQQANDVIQQQRHQLHEENLTLNQELINKNQQLTETNTELINHNNDLQQFSYTISHNLRGPLASITGLLSLVDESELGPSNQPLLVHLKSSVKALESTIRDLSHIIDSRNRITRLRQSILLPELMDNIITQLARDIEDNQVKIITSFEKAPEFVSVRPMVHSILYNLLSNAIKYRHPDRACVIQVSSTKGLDYIELAVTDNGMGIDLKRFGDKLFNLYRRFHSHIEGKGLGLFLVKQQAEALGGKIEVKSEIDKGSTFTIRFKLTEGINEQLLLTNDVVKIYYDASIDTLCVIWQKEHTAEQFEQVLALSLDFIKTYRTPNWISDVRKVPYRNEAALNKTRAQYRDDYLQVGLMRIAVVVNPESYSLQDYNSKKEEIKQAYPIEFYFFNEFEDAYDWIKAVNSKNKVS